MSAAITSGPIAPSKISNKITRKGIQSSLGALAMAAQLMMLLSVALFAEERSTIPAAGFFIGLAVLASIELYWSLRPRL